MVFRQWFLTMCINFKILKRCFCQLTILYYLVLPCVLQYKPHFDIYLQSNKMGVLSISCHLLHVYGSLLFLESHQPVEKCQRYLKIQANQKWKNNSSQIIYLPCTMWQVWNLIILNTYNTVRGCFTPFLRYKLCSLLKTLLWVSNVEQQ